MNEKVERLLEQLRGAIHEAIANSWSVAQVMVELEKECCWQSRLREAVLGPYARDELAPACSEAGQQLKNERSSTRRGRFGMDSPCEGNNIFHRPTVLA